MLRLCYHNKPYHIKSEHSISYPVVRQIQQPPVSATGHMVKCIGIKLATVFSCGDFNLIAVAVSPFALPECLFALFLYLLIWLVIDLSILSEFAELAVNFFDYLSCFVFNSFISSPHLYYFLLSNFFEFTL